MPQPDGTLTDTVLFVPSEIFAKENGFAVDELEPFKVTV